MAVEDVIQQALARQRALENEMWANNEPAGRMAEQVYGYEVVPADVDRGYVALSPP